MDSSDRNHVGQPFQAAGAGRFPAPCSGSQSSEQGAGKPPAPAGKNACPTRPSPLVSGFHSRDHLPHIKRENATYFVTFRLAGTLPSGVVAQLKREREQLLAQSVAAKRPLSWQEQEELFRWYAKRVDTYLDAGHGECWLKQSAFADLVAGALCFHAKVRFELRAWVLMPNHVHAVVSPKPGWTLSQILQSWKGYTVREANRLLQRTGHPFWQSESFDHLIRDEEDLYRCSHYTITNPVTARLCARPEQWKWSSAYAPSL